MSQSEYFLLLGVLWLIVFNQTLSIEYNEYSKMIFAIASITCFIASIVFGVNSK